MGWVIGIGCLSLILLGVLFFASIFGIVTTALKSSDVYQIAMATVERDPATIADLGAPIRAGWFVSGSIHVSGSSGSADISIPVSGSVRSGKVNAVATKASGKWSFSTLNVSIDGRPTMIEIPQRGQGLVDDVMGRDTTEGRDERDPAGIVLVCAVIQTLGRGLRG